MPFGLNFGIALKFAKGGDGMHRETRAFHGIARLAQRPAPWAEVT